MLKEGNKKGLNETENKDYNKKINPQFINKAIKAFNTSDFELKRIEDIIKEKQIKITILFFSQNLIFMSRILLSEIVITTLPFSPAEQLTLMGAIELVYMLAVVLSFQNFLGIKAYVELVSRLGQSTIFLAIYGTFGRIMAGNRDNEDTLKMQNLAIFWIIFGVFFELVFSVLKFLLLAVALGYSIWARRKRDRVQI